MKKVLVTGATGFIGRHCLPFLVQKGFEVHGTYSKDSNFQVEDVLLHQIDLLDEHQVKNLIRTLRPSYLLHLAWVTKPGELWNSLDNLRWVQSSLCLARNFIEHGGIRAVFGGTCAEYDWSYENCSEESTPLNPATLYGKCKKELFQSLSNLDLNWAWGRIFHLYGPYEPSKKLIASVILALLKGELALCSHGKQIRDFLHVYDIASAFSILLEGSVKGAINIASGIPVTLQSICLKIGEKLGAIEKIRFGALPSASNDPSILTADVKRLDNELQWKPAINLDQGLAQTIQWWKEHLATVGV